MRLNIKRGSLGNKSKGANCIDKCLTDCHSILRRNRGEDKQNDETNFHLGTRAQRTVFNPNGIALCHGLQEGIGQAEKGKVSRQKICRQRIPPQSTDDLGAQDALPAKPYSPRSCADNIPGKEATQTTPKV